MRFIARKCNARDQRGLLFTEPVWESHWKAPISAHVANHAFLVHPHPTKIPHGQVEVGDFISGIQNLKLPAFDGFLAALSGCQSSLGPSVLVFTGRLQTPPMHRCPLGAALG